MNKITVEEVKKLVKEEYHGDTLMMFFKEEACRLHEAAPRMAALAIRQAEELLFLKSLLREHHSDRLKYDRYYTNDYDLHDETIKAIGQDNDTAGE